MKLTEKRERQTRQIEMVETHNIALSMMRLKHAPGYSGPVYNNRCKRALYHALTMALFVDYEELKAIREALKLP